MWSFFLSVIRPKLSAIWKPLAIVGVGLLFLMRMDWLKRALAARKQEVAGLRTKEKIRDEHEKIEQQRDEVREEIADLHSAADAQSDYDRMRRPNGR